MSFLASFFGGLATENDVDTGEEQAPGNEHKVALLRILRKTHRTLVSGSNVWAKDPYSLGNWNDFLEIFSSYNENVIYALKEQYPGDESLNEGTALVLLELNKILESYVVELVAEKKRFIERAVTEKQQMRTEISEECLTVVKLFYRTLITVTRIDDFVSALSELRFESAEPTLVYQLRNALLITTLDILNTLQIATQNGKEIE